MKALVAAKAAVAVTGIGAFAVPAPLPSFFKAEIEER